MATYTPLGAGDEITWTGGSASSTRAVAPAGGGVLVAIGYAAHDSSNTSGGAIANSGWSGTAPVWTEVTPAHSGSSSIRVGLILAYAVNAYAGSGDVVASFTVSNLTGVAVVEITDTGDLTFADALIVATASTVDLDPQGDVALAAFHTGSTTDHVWSGFTELFDLVDSAFGAIRGSAATDDTSPGDPSVTPTSGNRVIGAITFTEAGGTPVNQDVASGSETDTGTAPRQTVAQAQPVDPASETGTAATSVQAVAQAQQVPPSTETDAATATSPATTQAETVASAAETASATPTMQAVARAQLGAVASELDTATSAVQAANLAQPVGVAVETDIAAPTVQDSSADNAVARAIENNSVAATGQLTALVQQLAPATETTTARPITQAVPRIQLVAGAIETNVAVAVLQLAEGAPVDQPAGPVRTATGQRRLATSGSRSLSTAGNRRLTTENV